MNQRLKHPELKEEDFDYDRDFYGQQDRWLSFNPIAKLFTLMYLIVYGPYKLALNIVWIISPLSKLNTVIQLKKKADNFKKV